MDEYGCLWGVPDAGTAVLRITPDGAGPRRWAGGVRRLRRLLASAKRRSFPALNVLLLSLIFFA